MRQNGKAAGRFPHMTSVRQWRYVTILGEYVHRDERYWYLRINGLNTRLDRTEWAIFS